jgi:type IV pilus assembly protein PilW
MDIRSIHHGFMLMELLIAMVVSFVVLGAAYAVWGVHQRYYRNQQLLMEAQQDLTGALLVMEQQIRMVGYDPQESGSFGIVDVRRYDLVESNRMMDQGQPGFFYTFDRNADGVLEGGPVARNGEHPNFRIQKTPASGAIYLSYDNGGGRRPLAGHIQAMGLAYAVDVDANGQLDTWNDGPHLIWAVDSDNDNLLDSHIDADDDGCITAKDDTNGDGAIDWNDGAPLNPQVALHHIKAVRVWLLAVTSQPVKGQWDPQIYVVGDRVLDPIEDGRLRRLMETTIECRNL